MSSQEMALVVMAAGMGSRFGGLKQIAPVGPMGETILDYSVHDAVKAGFTRIVFIIKQENYNVFREAVGEQIEKKIPVTYVFQDPCRKVPFRYMRIARKRKKPWGTAHAILCAEEAVHGIPFAVINADDYYGMESYRILAEHLKSHQNLCMCAFRLGNTLTENGTVSRGICVEKNGFLESVTEHTSLDSSTAFPMDTPVSMNMWGLNDRIFPALKEAFNEFFESIENPEKDEFCLPSVIDRMIKQNGEKVSILHTPEKWCGMTYKKDLPLVKKTIRELVRKGVYHDK